MSDKIYQEELMDHYKFPRNRKKVIKPDFSADDGNITCGDKIHIEGKIKDNKITEIGFEGSGCVVSQAAASMLTENVLGRTVQDVLNLTKDDIIKLLGIELGPNRLKCALLSLQVLKKGLIKIKQ